MELIGERDVVLYDYNDIGDEFHCLLKCPFLKKLNSQSYISRYYFEWPNTLKWIICLIFKPCKDN